MSQLHLAISKKVHPVNLAVLRNQLMRRLHVLFL